MKMSRRDSRRWTLMHRHLFAPAIFSEHLVGHSLPGTTSCNLGLFCSWVQNARRFSFLWRKNVVSP
jgi:hypothetical protein